jgi:hypothetical protein
MTSEANEFYPRESVGFVEYYDRWASVAVSVLRLVVCFLSMMVTTFVWAVIMLLLLPWPCQRIRQGNLYGHVTGQMLVRKIIPLFFYVLFSEFFSFGYFIFFSAVKFVSSWYCWNFAN